MGDRKAIFITGGGSGIGRAVALHFAERGWFVGLGDIDKSGLHETAELIGNGFVYSHVFDVRDRAAWDEALEAFSVASGGRIDVVFNNAGIPLGGSLIENSAEEIERCLDINLKGVLFGAQAAHPHLKKTAPGSCLLNTASAAGIYGTPGASVYSATKFGVRAVTESLDGEWSADGIKVASLMPSLDFCITMEKMRLALGALLVKTQMKTWVSLAFGRHIDYIQLVKESLKGYFLRLDLV